MAVLLFPDNTVLVNFALLNRMDLLNRLANGNGRWCATVALECQASSDVPGLGALLEAPDIFGSPWYPDAAELQDMLVLRQELASPGDRRNQHMGEAETLAIMLRRRVHGFFVTDDNDAMRLATREGISVVSTWHMLKITVRKDWIDRDTLWGYLQTLRRNNRRAPREVLDRPSFEKWIES